MAARGNLTGAERFVFVAAGGESAKQVHAGIEAAWSKLQGFAERLDSLVNFAETQLRRADVIPDERLFAARVQSLTQMGKSPCRIARGEKQEAQIRVPAPMWS